MATKREMVEELKKLGVTDADEDMSSAELAKMLAAAKAAAKAAEDGDDETEAEPEEQTQAEGPKFRKAPEVPNGVGTTNSHEKRITRLEDRMDYVWAKCKLGE